MKTEINPYHLAIFSAVTSCAIGYLFARIKDKLDYNRNRKAFLSTVTTTLKRQVVHFEKLETAINKGYIQSPPPSDVIKAYFSSNYLSPNKDLKLINALHSISDNNAQIEVFLKKIMLYQTSITNQSRVISDLQNNLLDAIPDFKNAIDITLTYVEESLKNTKLFN